MTDAIRQICALSVFCGLALALVPEGGVKKAASVLAALLLFFPIMTAVKDMDTDAYALDLARYRSMGSSLASESAERLERLNKQVIIEQCEEYILSRAGAEGLTELKAEVRVQWSTDGFWVPVSVRLTGFCPEDKKEKLRQIIAADLGIPKEEQEWQEDES